MLIAPLFKWQIPFNKAAVYICLIFNYPVLGLIFKHPLLYPLLPVHVYIHLNLGFDRVDLLGPCQIKMNYLYKYSI